MRNKHYFMVPNDPESGLIRIVCLILRIISNKVGGLEVVWSLMGEGFILLTRGYGFMGGCTTPLLTR